MRKAKSGFTLVELLVVIAVIALLIALLLPSLVRVRTVSRLAKSLANVHNLSTSMTTYRADFKGYCPAVMSWPRSSYPTNIPAPSTGLEGLCTWAFGGKNCDTWWGNQSFDVEAADRPMNPYIADNVWDAPSRPAVMQANDPSRKSQEMEIMRDPTDTVSFQRFWNAANPTPEYNVSCYNDVGTSYQYQVKWFDPIYSQWTLPTPQGKFYTCFNFGARRLAISDAFAPARMVWINDQYADVVANCTNVNFRLKNGYGDINRSVMAFMDGHAAYHNVKPGNVTTSFQNSDFTMVFEDLKIPH